mmetsp:Transcript_72864/g.202087  ORF Transcript_72864/g.202087 Transcript_72864/m.202087 type:complete len:282 (-) Transcript_72864:80-925(-)
MARSAVSPLLLALASLWCWRGVLHLALSVLGRAQARASAGFGWLCAGTQPRARGVHNPRRLLPRPGKGRFNDAASRQQHEARKARRKERGRERAVNSKSSGFWKYTEQQLRSALQTLGVGSGRERLDKQEMVKQLRKMGVQPVLVPVLASGTPLPMYDSRGRAPQSSRADRFSGIHGGGATEWIRVDGVWSRHDVEGASPEPVVEDMETTMARALAEDWRPEALSAAKAALLLGVTIPASEEEVRSAKRRLALRYHPDVNPADPRAAKAFRLVMTASDMLR